MSRLTLQERYDQQIADRMISLGNQMPGLPQYLGVRLLRFQPGLLWAQADLSSQVPTPSGNVHGGAIAAVLDHVTGAVVYPLIPDGHWGATTELKTNYVAPITPGLVQVNASVLAISNRSVVRGEAHQDDRLVAATQGTITVVAPRAS